MLWYRFVNMNELHFLILTSLARGPVHGYAVLKDIEAIAGVGSRPQVATLYRAIDRLALDGLIEEDGEEVHDGRFRRRYRPTTEGFAALAMEIDRRIATATIARQRLVGRDPWMATS